MQQVELAEGDAAAAHFLHRAWYSARQAVAKAAPSTARPRAAEQAAPRARSNRASPPGAEYVEEQQLHFGHGRSIAPRCHARLPAMPQPSRPLADCPDAAFAAVCGVLTDIDDTLTHEGAIEPQALGALAAFACAGLPVIAITGRPGGLSEPFAREWPITAIVAENGAVALFMRGGELQIEYAQDEATRTHNAQRLASRRRGACCARCRAARWRATAPGASPTRHRPQRVRAARRGSHRSRGRADGTRHERDGQFHPRQRLVRRSRQVERRAGSCSACSAASSQAERAGAGSMSATRPTTSSCSSFFR